jgi:pimeloyl-ACP methyl ester carboxylesterase
MSAPLAVFCTTTFVWELYMKRPSLNLRALIESISTKRKTHLLALSLSIVGVACSPDKAIAPGTQTSQSPRFMQVCDPNAGCDDGSVSPYDSYLIGDIIATTTATYSSDESFPDPQTGQTVNSVTVNSPAEHLHVEAGYDWAGQPVIHTSFTDGPDPQSDAGSQITQMATKTDVTTERNASGQVLIDETTPDAPDPTPMDLLGTLQNADVTSGALLDVNGSTSYPTSTRLSPTSTRFSNVQLESVGSALAQANPGAKIRVEQPAPSLLQITETMTEPILPRRSASTGSGTLGIPVQDRGVISHSKLYELRGGKWLLKELRTVTQQAGQGHSERVEHVMSVNILAWSVNAIKDAERRAKRPTAEVIPVSGSPAATATRAATRLIAPEQPRFLVPCDTNCGGGGGGSGPDVGADLGCGPNVVGFVHPDGANIILQHGMFSDAMTWCGSEPYLRYNFRVGFEIRHTLDSHARIDDQMNDLFSRVNSERGAQGQFILIGHSNGGLVSRRFAQLGQNTPGLIRGVITISTPNQGTQISTVPIRAAQLLFAGIGSFGCGYVSHTACYLLGPGVAGQIGGILAGMALNSNYPVVYDIQPNSPFLGGMNTSYEGFTRAGVQDYSWDKWTFFRIIGDFGGAAGGGRPAVKRADKTYHRAIDCAIIGGLTGFFWHPSWRVAAGCAAVAASLKGVDLLYKRITVPGESGDAVVPGHSQLYPNLGSQFQFAVHDADSHVGVLKSTSISLPVIVASMRNTFGLPPNQ